MGAGRGDTGGGRQTDRPATGEGGGGKVREVGVGGDTEEVQVGGGVTGESQIPYCCPLGVHIIHTYTHTFTPLQATRSESSLCIEQWTQCCRQLGHWDTLVEYSRGECGRRPRSRRYSPVLSHTFSFPSLLSPPPTL